MSKFLPKWVWVAVLVVAWGGCGFYLGTEHSNNAWLTKQAAQERQAREVLQAEQARGDALTTALLASTSEIDQLKQESHHAIFQATTGRTCFDSAALRVLQRAPGMSAQLTPTGGAAAARGPIAAPADDDAGNTASSGGEWATDTQVGEWAIDTASQYQVCRTRLDALIDWHTTGPSKP